MRVLLVGAAGEAALDRALADGAITELYVFGFEPPPARRAITVLRTYPAGEAFDRVVDGHNLPQPDLPSEVLDTTVAQMNGSPVIEPAQPQPDATPAPAKPKRGRPKKVH